MFIIGGLGALKGVGGYGAYIDMGISILLGAEHILSGNTTT